MRSNGFTLVELIIVIIIIVIVIKVLMPRFVGITTEARIDDLMQMKMMLHNIVDIIYSDSVIKHRNKLPMFAGQDMYGVFKIECSEDKKSSSTVCTSYGNPSALGNGVVLALEDTYSLKRMDTAGKCDALWGWCYYNPDTIKLKGGSNTPENLKQGTGTIYFASAQSPGYTGFLVDSCVVSYSLVVNSDTSSNVIIEVYSNGC